MDGMRIELSLCDFYVGGKHLPRTLVTMINLTIGVYSMY